MIKNLQFISIIILLFVFSMTITQCGDSYEDCKVKPAYNNFENDWDLYNLYGKVKEINVFKQSLVNPSEWICLETSVFTKKGMLDRRFKYSDDSELLQDEYYKYDDSNRLIWHKENIRHKNDYYLTTYAYDIDGYTSVSHTKSLYKKLDDGYKMYRIEDEHENVVLDSTTFPDLTMFTRYSNTYDKNNNLVKVDVVSNNSDLKGVEISYNTENRLIKSVDFYQTYSLEWLFEWQEGRQEKEERYIIEDGTRKQTSLLKFDCYYNEQEIYSYEQDTIMKSIYLSHQFDSRGNWKTRNVRTESKNEDDKKESYRREIYYWD